MSSDTFTVDSSTSSLASIRKRPVASAKYSEEQNHDSDVVCVLTVDGEISVSYAHSMFIPFYVIL